MARNFPFLGTFLLAALTANGAIALAVEPKIEVRIANVVSPAVVGSEIPIQIEALNTGTTDFPFVESVRAPFQLWAEDAAGYRLPAPFSQDLHGWGFTFIGAMSDDVLYPGESMTSIVNASDWISFEKPGRYTIYAGIFGRGSNQIVARSRPIAVRLTPGGDHTALASSDTARTAPSVVSTNVVRSSTTYTWSEAESLHAAISQADSDAWAFIAFRPAPTPDKFRTFVTNTDLTSALEKPATSTTPMYAWVFLNKHWSELSSRQQGAVTAQALTQGLLQSGTDTFVWEFLIDHFGQLSHHNQKAIIDEVVATGDIRRRYVYWNSGIWSFLEQHWQRIPKKDQERIVAQRFCTGLRVDRQGDALKFVAAHMSELPAHLAACISWGQACLPAGRSKIDACIKSRLDSRSDAMSGDLQFSGALNECAR